MVEDLIHALQNHKAVCEYQGLDFNADKVKYGDIYHHGWSSMKRYARIWQENAELSLFAELNFYQKNHIRFDKIEFCKNYKENMKE